MNELTGPDPVKREAAVARLMIAGARAIDPLLRTLETAAPDGQAAVLAALAGLAAPRTLEPIVALLRSPHPQVAEAAVTAVAAFLTARDADLAARAIGALAAICVDRREDEAVRLAALGALAEAGDPIVAPLREQLRHDPSERLRRAAAHGGNEAVGGEAAAARLEAAAHNASDDPQAIRQWIRDGASFVSLSTLHELVLALRERERAATAGQRPHWYTAIGAAHLALAQRGSRLAVFDLRDALDAVTPDRAADYVAAAAAVGDATCLEPLARAWQHAEGDTLRRSIEAAAGAIVARTGLTRRQAAWRKLAARYPDVAERLWEEGTRRQSRGATKP